MYYEYVYTGPTICCHILHEVHTLVVKDIPRLTCTRTHTQRSTTHRVQYKGQEAESHPVNTTPHTTSHPPQQALVTQVPNEPLYSASSIQYML